MGSVAKYRKRKAVILTATLMAAAYMPTALAGSVPDNAVPTKGEFVNDTEGVIKPTYKKDGKTVQDIELSGKTGAINWESFNIGSKAVVNFSSKSGRGWLALNRVVGNGIDAIKESTINGALNGRDGTVYLVNPSGIVFTANANVDVGNLVATTMDVKQDGDKFIFTKSDSNTSSIKIQKNAEKNLVAKITANDGYVAMFAHKIYNDGIITAPEVAMASGNKITLSYADKIDLALDIDVLKNATATNDKNAKRNNKVVLDEGLISTGNGYVLMTKDTADDVIGHTIINDSIITNSGSIVATGIGHDENGNPVLVGGNISMTAAKVMVDGSLSAKGGDVTTTGYDVIQVNDTAKVHAATVKGEAGTWNVNGKNIIVGTGINDSTWNSGKVKESNVSNKALNEALADTNVNLLASPQMKEYYADIRVEAPITKTTGDKTELTFSAGRSISVEADIKSTGSAGALDITLNASDKKDTNSERGDGAVIMKGNIETNGGDFATTGKLGTYFGLKKPGDVGKVERYVKTKGGNITLGGEEVLLATGGEVLLDTTNPSAKGKNGKVIIDGEINSANSYFDKDAGKYISWSDANEGANEYYKTAGTAEGTTHLAVITSALEDAVSNATMNQDYSQSKEAYVGGHVVAVELNEDGSIKLDENNLPTVKKDADGNVVIIVNDPTNEKTTAEHRNGGWYVAERDENGKAVSYVRYWAWTAGDEAGTIIYKQTAGENVAGDKGFKDMPEPGTDPSGYDKESKEYEWLTKPHGEVLNDAYVNFAPGEPNDGGGRTEGSETALAVNHDTYFDEERGNVLVSKWDDMPDGSGAKDENAKKQTKMRNYVVETEIGKSALKINAGDTLLKGKVGNITKLTDLTIKSSGSIDTQGSVQVVNKIAMAADNNVTIHDALTADAKNTDNAIDIRAQQRFLNEASDSAHALKVDSSSNWKVYSDTPYEDDFGSGVGKSSTKDLNSGNFAVWGWDGKSTVSGKENLYIFKYHPTLTYTAKDAQKRYGVAISNTGYTFANELSGKFLDAFSDGHDDLFAARLSGAKVGTDSAGYPASAWVGSYPINMVNATTAKAWGYNIVENPGTLVVTFESEVPDKPQMDQLVTSNLQGTASYTMAQNAAGPGVDRVLGLQTAELPFFNEKKGTVKLYGTYDVTVDPDQVKMEPTAKVLPEPDQPKNQYREYERDLTTKDGTGRFRLTYDGSTFNIYPTDEASAGLLAAGDGTKNVEVESQALYAAFKEMGITLDDLDGVYTHFEKA